MKTKLLLSVVLLTLCGFYYANAAVPERKGWWKFDDPTDLLKAEIGTPLTLAGTQSSVDGPAEGNLATQIGVGSYLSMTHGIAANGGGSLVNEYSLQFDILMPEASMWHAIYQTATDNSEDAEMFINTDNLIGAWRFGYSTNSLEANTWYRLVVTVKNGEFFKIFMDGELWVEGAGQDVDGRDALMEMLLVFADNDGEDNTMQLAEVGIWDVALTDSEVAELGDCTTVPGPVMPQRLGWWKFDDAADMLKAEIGSALALTGTQESVEGPVEGNLATLIGTGSYLTMTHGITANGGGSLVNEFSLQVDFSMPEASLWHAIYQTAADNSEDAELFINTDNLIGAWRFGYSTNTVAAENWYRMIVTVKNGEFYKLYMNGEIWVDGTGQDIDGRDALMDVLLIFADNDGEDSPMKCSELGIWDVALTSDEVATLGDASSTGIFDYPRANAGLLGNNYPNPFSLSTTFPYTITKTGDVTFRIMDMAGKEVKVIRTGRQVPGSYTLNLDSEGMSSGMYYVQMATAGTISMQKIFVVK
jgi:hypothetical protein